MFTSRFLSFPIIEYITEYSEEKTADVEVKFTYAYARINPLDISSYVVGMEQEESGEEIPLVIVMTKNGNEFNVNMTIKEFEKKLNNWAA